MGSKLSISTHIETDYSNMILRTVKVLQVNSSRCSSAHVKPHCKVAPAPFCKSSAMNGACWGVGCKKQGVASLSAWQQRYCFESPQTSYCVKVEGEKMPSSCQKKYFKHGQTNPIWASRLDINLCTSSKWARPDGRHAWWRQKNTILYTFSNQTHSQYHPILLGEW